MYRKRLKVNKAPSRGERALFMAQKRGLTLVELLIVIFIFASSFGCFALALGAVDELFALIELKKAHTWLQRTFIEACQTGRPFILKYTTRSASASKLYVQWLDTLEEDVFDSCKGCYFRGMSASESYSVYSPQWHTLTPGVTIKVTNGSKVSSKSLGYIVISPYCYITVRKDPP